MNSQTADCSAAEESKVRALSLPLNYRTRILLMEGVKGKGGVGGGGQGVPLFFGSRKFVPFFFGFFCSSASLCFFTSTLYSISLSPTPQHAKKETDKKKKEFLVCLASDSWCLSLKKTASSDVPVITAGTKQKHSCRSERSCR